MNIYFSGIGGVAIGPLAEIALDAGHPVSGSDQAHGLMTKKLESRDVQISYNQDGSFLRKQHETHAIDWFVYTAALPENHPELVEANRLGIKCTKRDELIAQIISEKNLKLIAVAGTHGKTTTTGMMVWALQELGVPVSYSIGTTLSWGPSGKFDPKSEYFVYECDEFDRNFLHFYPHLSLITNIEYDHPDTYPVEDEYKSAFLQFIHQSEKVILWQADADWVDVHSEDAWCLQNNEVAKLSLAGAHNRKNGTLIVKSLERLGFDDIENNRKAINSFPGVERRFERLADNLYTDYGHTPTEIAATLQMARELSNHVVLVYQPHQNRRQHDIRDQYTNNIFSNADEIYWSPTYLSRENNELLVLSPRDLTKHITHPKLFVTNLDDQLWETITTARKANKLVLCMGAGDIDGWVRAHLRI